MSESEQYRKKRGRPVLLTLSAKKRKKAVLDAKWNASRINIGPEITRWNNVKDEMNLKTHDDVA